MLGSGEGDILSSVDALPIEVTVHVDSTDPPVGTVRYADAALRFEGWLGLLEAMSDLIRGEDGRKAAFDPERPLP